MITPVTERDIAELVAVAKVAVSECVASSKEEAELLGEEVETSLEQWWASGGYGFHAKFCENGQIAGFVVIKAYWNMSHLFVLPKFHGCGVGRALVLNAIEACRDKSPTKGIQLNSSDYASAFYSAVGFSQAGPALERSGGCEPFVYNF
jgi:predicted GNAT family N-acyltransferase